MSRRAFLAVPVSVVTVPILTTAMRGVAEDSPPPQKQFKKLKVCIIGDTNVGGYGHSLHLAWAFHENVQVVALADPDERGRQVHAAEAQALHQYARYEEMLEKEKPDIVTIGPRCTIRHKEYLLAAVAVGAHGFMEKPIADDLAEADDMIHAIEEKQLKWAIGFNLRVTPAMEQIRQAIFEDGIIGEVLEIRARGKEDARAGGEDMLVLGVHLFDLMRFFLGKPSWCQADITVNGKPAAKDDAHEATEAVGRVLGDRIHATFGFENGMVGYFSTTRNLNGNGNRWGLDIYGSKGIVSIRMNGGDIVAQWFPDPSWTAGTKAVQWQTVPKVTPAEMTDPAKEQYLPITVDLLAAIRENRRPKVSLQDGRDALEMVQAVYAAHFSGGHVTLPLEKRVHPLKG